MRGQIFQMLGAKHWNCLTLALQQTPSCSLFKIVWGADSCMFAAEEQVEVKDEAVEEPDRAGTQQEAKPDEEFREFANGDKEFDEDDDDFDVKLDQPEPVEEVILRLLPPSVSNIGLSVCRPY